jgi:hypothetical protein
MMHEQRAAELDAEFREVLHETPIHRGRWVAVLVAFVMLFTAAPYASIWWTHRQVCDAVNKIIDGQLSTYNYIEGRVKLTRPEDKDTIEAFNHLRALVPKHC